MANKKPTCDYDCFHCKFPDCINNRPATKIESALVRDALGGERKEKSLIYDSRFKVRLML